jgi:hypothetical protein
MPSVPLKFNNFGSLQHAACLHRNDMDDCALQQKFNLKSDDKAVTGEPKRIIFFWEPNENLWTVSSADDHTAAYFQSRLMSPINKNVALYL